MLKCNSADVSNIVWSLAEGLKWLKSENVFCVLLVPSRTLYCSICCFSSVLYIQNERPRSGSVWVYQKKCWLTPVQESWVHIRLVYSGQTSVCVSVDLLVSVHVGLIVIVCVILSVDPLARSWWWSGWISLISPEVLLSLEADVFWLSSV